MHIHSHGTGIHRTGAFTVLELLVTLAVAAALLLTAVPAFHDFTRRQQMKAAVNSLQNGLLLARSEAVHRNGAVVACPGDDRAGCTGGRNWSDGWIVFPDLNDDRRRQADETLLLHEQRLGTPLIHSSRGRTSIRFLGDGSSPGSNTNIAFCGPGGPPRARKLVVSNIGRIRRDEYPDIDSALCPTG